MWREPVSWIIAIWSVNALGGCGHSGAAAPEESGTETIVEIDQPQVRQIARTLTVTGTLHGDEEATLAAKVSGRVVQIMKDLGDIAQPGEPLLQVDPTDYALARDERLRAFREVLAKLGLAALPPAEFDVDQLPSVERARLQAANAGARLERSRTLLDRDPPLISQQDFDDLKTTWDVAQSNLTVERLNAASNIANARTLDAQVRIAEQRLLDTVHRAPEHSQRTAFASSGSLESPQATIEASHLSTISYQVAQRVVSVGDFVQIGDPLFHLVDSSPLKLRAMVPERRIGDVKIDQPASVRVEAFVDPFPGTVSRISPSVDIATRSFMVELLIANEDGRLKPGAFASAAIEVDREPALVIQESSVITFAGVHKVFVIADGRAVERRVTLGDRADGFVEIRSGLETGQAVIARPASTITTGTVVRVIESRADSAHGQAGSEATK